MHLPSIGAIDDYELRRELRRGIEQLCADRAELMSQDERDRLINEIIDEVLGLGPIDPLLRDPTITDILINGPRTVYVEPAAVWSGRTSSSMTSSTCSRSSSGSPAASAGGSTSRVPWSTPVFPTAAASTR